MWLTLLFQLLMLLGFVSFGLCISAVYDYWRGGL